jgi:hypothetical protein
VEGRLDRSPQTRRLDAEARRAGTAGETDRVGERLIGGLAEGDDVCPNGHVLEELGGDERGVGGGGSELGGARLIGPRAVGHEHDRRVAGADVERVVGGGLLQVVAGPREPAAGPRLDAVELAAQRGPGGLEGVLQRVAVALEVRLVGRERVVEADVEALTVEEAGGVAGDRGADDVRVGVVAEAHEADLHLSRQQAVVGVERGEDAGDHALPAGLVVRERAVHRRRVVEHEQHQRLLHRAGGLVGAGGGRRCGIGGAEEGQPDCERGGAAEVGRPRGVKHAAVGHRRSSAIETASSRAG